MPDSALKNIARQYHLSPAQLERLCALLGEGYSVPYIMRYHKDLAATPKAEDLYELIEEKRRAEELDRRAEKILNKLAA